MDVSRDAELQGCRLVACRASDGAWEFVLVNDRVPDLDGGALEAIETEWGDRSHRGAVQVVIPPLAVGEHALLWKDRAGDTEFRLRIHVRLRWVDRTAVLVFEFPRLYRLDPATVVPGLGRPGIAVRAMR